MVTDKRPGGVVERRGGDEMDPTLQLSDDVIIAAQQRSKLIKRMLAKKVFSGMEVTRRHGLSIITTITGYRLSCIGGLVSSVKYGDGWLVAKNAEAAKRDLVMSYLHFGSYMAVTLVIACPLPVASGGHRYVIAALEYVTRYAVAMAVKDHTPESVTEFLMKNVLLTDGAPELTGRAIDELVQLLQAKQTNPVPYQPQMIGLVGRYHRTWKDVVSTYMQREEQNDWESF
ncbi:hypothetical protein PHMEG_00041173, partial [Phytophthora megakarya]